jgi:hypothetical protein
VPGFVNYKKGCTRLAATSDKDYQLLAHGQWFSPGTPASSTTKTGRHDIAESGVKHQKSINHVIRMWPIMYFLRSPMLRHINKRGGSERSDINQIDNNHLLTFVLTYF